MRRKLSTLKKKSFLYQNTKCIKRNIQIFIYIYIYKYWWGKHLKSKYNCEDKKSVKIIIKLILLRFSKKQLRASARVKGHLSAKFCSYACYRLPGRMQVHTHRLSKLLYRQINCKFFLLICLLLLEALIKEIYLLIQPHDWCF